MSRFRARSSRKPDLASLDSEPFEEMLRAMGFDPSTDEGLFGTPERMRRAYQELLAGYDITARKVLGTRFDASGYDEIVCLKDIEFTSLCEHHLLPFTGAAAIAYLPRKKVVGLSKLARLVEMHARRLQIQEIMTRDIAADITRELAPAGVAVIVEAHHQCMGCRGVRKPLARMVTSSMTGAFRKNASARLEVLSLMGVR